jgi:thiol-disulfide isomerase/thioredoxin
MKNLFLCLIVFPSVLVAQHTIKGTFSPASKFTYAFLYHATPTSIDYVNQAAVNPDGTFEIKLDASVKKGIYKIVYAVPTDENMFEFFYDGNETIELQFDLEKGLSFSASKSNMLWDAYTKDLSEISNKISQYYSSNSNDTSVINSLFEELRQTQNNYEIEAKETIAYPFIVSNRLYIPDTAEDAQTYSQNILKHYFENIDFSNTYLQSSDYLKDRISAYVFAMPPNSAYYKKAVDDVAIAMGNNNTIKLSLLLDIWQSMIEKEINDVATYISDTYLIQLAQEQNNEVLVDVLLSFKKTAIGTKTPNFEITDNQTLYDLDTNDRYVVIFWSSICGHCLNELPILKSLISNYPDIKVVAFGIEDDIENWKNVSKNYPDFIQVIGLGRWDNPVVKEYGIDSTPTYFVLDKDKIIRAKPDNVEALKSYLED